MVSWWFAVVLATAVQVVTLVAVEFGAIRPLQRRLDHPLKGETL